MRLPIRERQIAQPVEQVVQPIEQTYDLQSAELDKAQGQLMQDIGRVAKARADQLNLQYRNAVSNQIGLTYQEQAQEKARELLSRQGMDARGAAHDFNVFHTEVANKLLFDIEDPEDREAMRLKFENARIQYEDQLSGHQVVQVREANQKVLDATNHLDLISAFQYSTPENIESRSSAIRSRLEADAKANGLPLEYANAKLQELNTQMITGIVKNYAANDDYVTAQARLEKFADLVGGKDSGQYKALATTIDDLKFKYEISDNAGKIVTQYFRDPNGLKKAHDAVVAQGLNAEKRDLMLREVGQKWSLLKTELQERTNREMDIIGNNILNIQMDMRSGKISPQEVARKYLPEIDKLLLRENNILDIGSIRMAKERLWKAIETESSHIQSKLQTAATRAVAEETRRERQARAAEKAQIESQEADMFNVLYNRPNEVANMGSMMQRWPKVDLSKIKELATFFGKPNNRDIELNSLPPRVQDALDSITKDMSSTEKLNKTVEFCRYARTAIADFQNKNKRELDKPEYDAILFKAATETKMSKGFMKGKFHEFEFSNRFKSTITGKEYRRKADGLYYLVEDSPSNNAPGYNLTEIDSINPDMAEVPYRLFD